MPETGRRELPGWRARQPGRVKSSRPPRRKLYTKKSAGGRNDGPKRTDDTDIWPNWLWENVEANREVSSKSLRFVCPCSGVASSKSSVFGSTLISRYDRRCGRWAVRDSCSVAMESRLSAHLQDYETGQVTKQRSERFFIATGEQKLEVLFGIILIIELNLTLGLFLLLLLLLLLPFVHTRSESSCTNKTALGFGCLPAARTQEQVARQGPRPGRWK